MDVGGGYQFEHFGPARPHKAALAPGRFVRLGAGGVADQLGPGLDRISQAGFSLPVHLEQHAPHVGVADPGWRVRVPGKRGSSRATTGLVLGRARPDGRVVDRLGLPGYDPVLYEHPPRTRASAVDAVGRTHDFVVAPALAVKLLRPAATTAVQLAAVRGRLTALYVAGRPDEPAVCDHTVSWSGPHHGERYPTGI